MYCNNKRVSKISFDDGYSSEEDGLKKQKFEEEIDQKILDEIADFESFISLHKMSDDL